MRYILGNLKMVPIISTNCALHFGAIAKKSKPRRNFLLGIALFFKMLLLNNTN